MLTVCIEYPNHNTNVFEVQGVEDILTQDERHKCVPGVLLRYEDGTQSHYGRNDTPRGIKFYVMNRYGSTVAQYSI